MDEKQNTLKKKSSKEAPAPMPVQKEARHRPRETGGPTGPEPTRYGDWERRGRCIDF